MRVCLLISIWLLSFFTIGEAYSQSTSLPAFPGAEGFGKYTTGGRGGKVFIVKNLNDSGAGSLREAIEASGPRTIVFEVSGTIELQSRLNIRNGDLTIAGQTAPGDGITLKNYSLRVLGTNNVIIRYIRVRLGDLPGLENDAFEAINCQQLIVDHCTFSWGTDETCSVYNVENVTIQNSIISEGLHDSVHEKGPHGFGSLFGGNNVSFYRNLMAHFMIRMTSRTSMGTRNGVVDMRENVFYNWRFRATDNGANTTTNLIRNYYKPGPATFATSNANTLTKRFLNPTMSGGDPNTYGKFYLEGNYMPTIDLSKDQWLGVRLENGTNQRLYLENCKNKDKNGNTVPFPIPNWVYSSGLNAQEAYEEVLTNVGASLSRDPVDKRLINEVRTGTNTYKGSKTGHLGIIDSQKDVGGWPQLKSLPALKDTDRDGMPDEWEIANGLDPNKADDKGYNISTEYTNIEVYINSLVEPSTDVDSIIDVTGLKTTPTSSEIEKGKTQQVTATVSPSNASNKKVIWTSSNTEIATVNGSGLVTAKEVGSAIITAKTEDGDFTAKTEITVKEINNFFGVESFTLIDAGSNTAIAPLSDGDALFLEDVQNLSLNFRANTNPVEVGSVYFSLTGPVNSSRTDNGYTYDLLNNVGLSLPAGNYTLTAIPYAERNRGGTKGTELTIAFSIIDEDFKALNLSFGVEDFTLIDAGSNTAISKISDGDELDLKDIRNKNLNFRANITPIEVGSVFFSLEGPVKSSRIDNGYTYDLLNNEGHLLSEGTYKLTAIPYTERNRGGDAGTGLFIKFEVIDSEKILAPTTPVLISPTNGSKDLDTSINLSWKKVENADTYRVQVSLTKDFSNRILDKSNLKNTDYQLEQLEAGQTYYWRVRATNTAGNSSYTATWSFSTKASVLAPSAPQLSSPESGTLVNPSEIVLEWLPAERAEKYEVQVSTFSNFSQGIAYQSNNITNHKIAVNLDPDKIYFWRVRAINAAGTSPYSTVWSLITESLTPLDSPILLSPNNGTIIKDTKIDLIWDDVEEVSTYQLELSTESSFGNMVFSQSNMKVTYESIDNLQPGTTYYWRVIASGDRPGSQSEVWSFSVADAEEEVEEPLEINVFPNPFQEFINVEFSKLIEEDIYITLLNNRGQTIMEKQFKAPGNGIYLDIPQGIRNGPYHLKIQTSSFIETRKVIKR